MESIRKLRRISALCATLALLILPAAALAELAKWDQERVTQTAEEFASSMKELRKEMQAAPKSTDPARQRALYVALDDIRVMTNSATLLANKLKAGEGREETYAVWWRLEMLRRDFEENARKADIEDAIMEKIVKAGALLVLRINPYYKSEGEEIG